MTRRNLFLAVFLLFVLLTACSRSPEPKPASKPSSQQIFQVQGTIREIKPDGKTIVIRHEAIPDYMPAMTMPFTAKSPGELRGLRSNDVISFRMLVTDDDVFIDQIRKAAESLVPETSLSSPTPENTNSSFRIVRDVEPLAIGEKLPEFHFTNQLGQAVSTTQFQASALAISFIFTRCPLPTFCPRMSGNFEATQAKLLALAESPTNWQLLTISFDPEFDSPAVLKAYSDRFKADPRHWTFLTGDQVEISAIADSFGQKFWKEEGAINHNLRTAVVDAAGKVQQIFTGNSWTADDLVAELIKATAAR